MKRLKMLYAVMAFLALSFVGIGKTYAQRGQGRMTPEQRVAMLKERLDLTDDQTAKIKVIYMDLQTKMQALRQSGDAPDVKKEQRRTMNQEAEKQITAILTPEQIQKWKAMKEEMRAKMKQQNGGTPPPPEQ